MDDLLKQVVEICILICQIIPIKKKLTLNENTPT